MWEEKQKKKKKKIKLKLCGVIASQEGSKDWGVVFLILALKFV